MALEIQSGEREGIAILDLKGRITVGPEATALREQGGRIERGRQAQRDSEPSRSRLHRQHRPGRAGDLRHQPAQGRRSVKLLNLNRRNIELLVMTKLATVFEIFADEQDAINSFYPDRKIKTFDILDFVQNMKKEEG